MRVLVVEDNMLVQEQLKKKLSHAGYAVDAVDNGIDAEHMGTQEPYDAVVLDLGLPKRPGIEVLKSWRQAGNRVPVIILTGEDAWHQKVEGFKVGADDYLGKPFHVEELVARLNSLVHRRHGQTGGRLVVDGLTLNEDRQSVIATDGRELQLTGVEFRLLRYFMMRPRQVLSKSLLSEHIYDFDSDKDSNVIEVYINRLRHKVGKAFIHTRRGQGYVFGISN